MRIGSHQDLMLTVPALQQLRQLLPDATITLMVSPATKELGLQIPWVDGTLVYEGADSNFRNPECELALIAKIRQFSFDASVIFTNPWESPYTLAYICYLAGIPVRIGQSQEFGGGVLSHWVKPEQKYRNDRGIQDDPPNTKNHFFASSQALACFDPVNYYLFLLASAFKQLS